MSQRFFLGIFLVFLILNGTMAQMAPFKSIHQLEYEAHKHIPKQPSLFDSTGKGIVRLAKTVALQKPAVTVFGYLPDWEYLASRNYLQYDALTHIAAFDFTVSASGSVSKPSYWPWTDVINEAHANGVKVILTAVNFNADDIHNLLTNSQAKQNFFANLKTLLGQYNLDGVNIDFEGLYSDDRGSLLNGFMADLSAAIKQDFPEAEISFAGPAVNWGGWDFKGLADACDYIFIMGYAFAGSWSSTSGANAPLTGGSFNITNTVTVQYASVTNERPEKLILGVPYYGVRWKTASDQPHASTIEFIDHPRFSLAEPEAQNYGRLWDQDSQTPWYRYQSAGQWYQVWFDDSTSLGLKYDLADSKRLRGVGMWALGYDGARNELWDLLRKRYVNDSLPLPVAPRAIVAKPADQSGKLLLECEELQGIDGYEVYLSLDGQTFSMGTSASSNHIVLENLLPDTLYFLKVRTFNAKGKSDFSSVVVASTTAEARLLLVDGFDRNSDGNNTYAFLIQHGKSFFKTGVGIASATNDALIQQMCVLDSFVIVDWMSGDESEVDVTFNPTEQQLVKQYLEQGGNFFVSGAEIGYDLVQKGTQQDQEFFTNYLKAEYVSDAPLNQKATYYSAQALSGTIFESVGLFYFDDGTHGTYDVDWPDAIRPLAGAHLGVQYVNVDQTNGGAVIYFQGTFGTSSNTSRLVYSAIPFETIYPLEKRDAFAKAVVDFFEKPLTVASNPPQLPFEFQFLGQYPNPFNSQTRFAFSLGKGAKVSLEIFDALGRRVFQKIAWFDAGKHHFNWNGTSNAGKPLASGVYLFRLQAVNQAKVVNHQGKVMLVK